MPADATPVPVEKNQRGFEAPLRAAVIDWLGDRVLGKIAADDIMLTQGGQNSIGLVLNCCLRGDRPVVLTEDLSYPGFRYAARAQRAEVVGIEMDDEGILPDALEAACRKFGPQVLCLTPETQNPTTARMSVSRRLQVIAIARRHDTGGEEGWNCAHLLHALDLILARHGGVLDTVDAEIG